MTTVRAVFAAACMVVMPLAASAAERVALLIGNNNYADERARLKNAVNDATDVADVLRKANFKVILRSDVSGAAMRDAIQDFAEELKGAKIALFYYAGHALQFQGNNFILPTDASLKTENNILVRGVDLSTVFTLMSSARVARPIVILDACRDNPFSDRFRVVPGLAQTAIPDDAVVAYAAKFGVVALDGNGRNSVYTGKLLKYLPVPGENLLDVFAKVNEDVQRETSGSRQPQSPVLMSGGGRDGLVLFQTASLPPKPTSVPDTVSVDTLSKLDLAFWQGVDRSRRADVELYLDRYPNGNFAAQARQDLARLASVTQVATIAGSAATGSPAENGRGTGGQTASAAGTSPAATVQPPPSVTPVATPGAATGAASAADTKVAMSNPVLSPVLPPVAVAAVAPVAPPASTQASKQGASAIAPFEPPQPPPGATLTTIKFSDGSEFRGVVANGQPHGFGEYESKSERYRGEYRNGRKEGNGSMTVVDSFTYEGSFREGRPDGTGTMRFVTGDVYSGNFVMGVMDGKGRYTFAKSNEVYEGDVVKGEFTGEGVLRRGNGEVFEGQFVKGKLNGIGRARHENGFIYRGEFRDDKWHGQGTLQHTNGMVYTGQFVDGEPKGRGMLTFTDGSRFDGEFQNGLLGAKGTVIYTSGDRRAAEIVDGQLSAAR